MAAKADEMDHVIVWAMVAVGLVVALPVVVGALLGRLSNHTLHGAVVGAVLLVRCWLIAAAVT